MSDAPLALKQDAAVQKASKSITFTPTNFTEAVQFAKMLSTSELVPKDYRGKHTNILVAMQMGAEVGLAPMQALQSIAVINGKPSVYGDAALAIVQCHPAYDGHKETISGDGDNRTAVCVVRRKGQVDPAEGKFSIKDAKTARLWGKEGPWQQYPDRMLQMRARGFALRDKFADALKGMILVEEAGDYNRNSPARGNEIERAELTTAAQLGTLSQSKEPNRGHGNEGTERQRQPEKTMCAECRQVDGHAADCPQAKKQTKGKKSPREQWESREGHDPKKHINFDEALQLFKLEKNLGISEEEMKKFLADGWKIEHRHLIPQNKYQEILGTMATKYGKNSAVANPDAEDPEESESAEDGGERNTEIDGLFDDAVRSRKDPG